MSLAPPPPARVLTLWCPDWPLVALDQATDAPAPVAVLVGEHVLVASPAARASGVRRGLRRREAQRRCPELLLLDRDEAAEMRAFEPLLRALENVCPLVEVVRPGLALFPAKGASRYFGGDVELARVVVRELTTTLRPHPSENTADLDVPFRIGIADGPFASRLAARQSGGATNPVIVDPGGTAAFLAPFPVDVLDQPTVTHLFMRLGLRTLGDLAALPARKVASRFGPAGARIHQLSRGAEEHLLIPRTPALEIDVREELDPPEERIEPLAFIAKTLADRLQEELGRRGLRCTRLLVEAESEHGETRSRQWRHEETLTAAAISQRVRWQLDGWLTGAVDQRPTAGICLLRLTPTGLHPEDGEQLRLLGGPTDADRRASAAITRLQATLGFDAVRGAAEGSGRAPSSYFEPVSWGEISPPTAGNASRSAKAPWPGRLPAPHPTVLYPDPLPAAVFDTGGKLITFTDRGTISAVPQGLSIQSKVLPVLGWSGPWLVEERWWGQHPLPTTARLQLVTADQSARLVVYRDARWWIEGEYE